MNDDKLEVDDLSTRGHQTSFSTNFAQIVKLKEILREREREREKERERESERINSAFTL